MMEAVAFCNIQKDCLVLKRNSGNFGTRFITGRVLKAGEQGKPRLFLFFFVNEWGMMNIPKKSILIELDFNISNLYTFIFYYVFSLILHVNHISLKMPDYIG